MNRQLIGIVGGLLILIASPWGQAADPKLHGTALASAIEESVEKALPYIEQRGRWWIDKKECMSCHRVSNMIWTLSAAEVAGYELSEDLQTLRQWSVESSMAEDDDGVTDAQRNKEGVAQLILAGREALPEDVVRQYRDMLASTQEENGTWGPSGQLPGQKRPNEETRDVSAAWIALSLCDSSNESHRQSLDRAVKAMSLRKTAESIEWYAVRLLLARQLGEEEIANQCRQALIDTQQADGGWGWLAKDPSDALGTGIALYALLPEKELDASIVLKAQNFLISNQETDGRWKVKGTKKAKKDRIEETATYWGSAWATLALIQSQPSSVSVD